MGNANAEARGNLTVASVFQEEPGPFSSGSKGEDVNHHPYHPIIYVRGFAASHGEIEDTVADPYMGFNIGSTKARQVWTGDIKRFYFESPLVRLMGQPYNYEDVFVDGEDLLAVEQSERKIPYKCIIIYRYYDEASDVFGTGKTPPIQHFAAELSTLIKRLRDKVCAVPENEVAPEDFRVYLVAHSMGGLVCRAFLQNPKLDQYKVRNTVDKLFTYATPHNGIDMRIVRNVPGWVSFGDVNNFNRPKMAEYLGLKKGTDDVSEVTGFPPDHVFNLVGTNPRDYAVAAGLSSWAVGESSDGLVRMENATTFGIGADGKRVESPRAFVHRSHSGHFGIVNCEEGFQNLTRFLFGKLRVDGILDVDAITLPEELAGKEVKASYHFEVAAGVRGSQWQITRREVRENSAIFRKWDDLFRGGQADRSRSPHLFSIFLDPRRSQDQVSQSVSFAFDLKVLVPDYEVDGALFLKRHYEGGFLLQDRILIEAFPDEQALGGWRILYGHQRESANKADIPAEVKALDGETGITFSVPLEQATRPGFKGQLRIEARPWS